MAQEIKTGEMSDEDVEKFLTDGPAVVTPPTPPETSSGQASQEGNSPAVIAGEIGKGAEGEGSGGDTPPAVPAGTPLPAENTPPTPPETSSGQASQEGTLLAGKYKTTDDLAKGITEIGKPLGINPKVLETTVALAKKTGDWTEVENLYKELDTELSSKRATEAEKARLAEEARRTAGQEPLPKETSAPGTGLDERQQTQLVFEETYREITQHPLVREMREQGIDLPRTKEDWQALKTDQPFYAVEFGKLFAATFGSIQQELKEYVGVLSSAEETNKTMLERNTTLIREEAKRVGLTLTDAEIATAIEAAKKSAVSYQQKHGVNLLTEDGIYKHFLWANHDKLKKQLELTAEARGRAQAAEDMKKLRASAPGTISTAGLPATKRDETKPIDKDSPTELALATDEQLVELLN